MAGPSSEFSIVSDKFEEFKCSANDAVHFKLVRSVDDVLGDSQVFHPDMSHQVFGESESIFGYKDLRIDVYCSASRMTTYVNVKHGEKIDPNKFDGVQPDNVVEILSKALQPGFLTNRDDFITCLDKDKTFKPFGELVHSYTVIKDAEEKQFEIYRTDIEEPGFRDYHERLQPFLLFYVDAASFIDVDDDRWMYYLLFEKYKNKSGETLYVFAGYMTVYNYYAYPEKIRPRISQVLVMPPFQKQGHGATMIQTFYNECFKKPEVLDITVEDPSENFQRVRDYVDSRNCMKLSNFQPEKLHDGFSQDLVKEAQEKLRINKKQARRVYEILRLKATSSNNNQQYRLYRLDIKRRLNVPFQKKGRDFDKFKKALQPNELAAAMNNLSSEQRLEFLEKQFQECVDEYRAVVERLARD